MENVGHILHQYLHQIGKNGQRIKKEQNHQYGCITVTTKYRNNQQIAGSILIATQEAGIDGIAVTNLMQKSNLSHTRLGEFINKLTSSGLINKIEYDGKNTFIITEKGRMYLQEYQRFLQMAHTFGLDL